MADRVEWHAERRDALDSPRSQLGQKLIAYELDASGEVVERLIRFAGRARAGAGGGNCTVEVIYNLEELHQNEPFASFDLACHVSSKAQSGLFELVQRTPMVRRECLKLGALLGELPLQVFYVGRLTGTTIVRLLAVALLAGPPAAIDDANLSF